MPIVNRPMHVQKIIGITFSALTCCFGDHNSYRVGDETKLYDSSKFVVLEKAQYVVKPGFFDFLFGTKTVRVPARKLFTIDLTYTESETFVYEKPTQIDIYVHGIDLIEDASKLDADLTAAGFDVIVYIQAENELESFPPEPRDD